MYGNNRSFARRQALFTSSTVGRYVRMSVDSCLDNVSEDGDASSISARSTRSLRSFRRWKKAQRRKRQLKKSASVFEFTLSGDSYRRKAQSSVYNHGKKTPDMSVTGDTSTFADAITDDKTERSNGIDRNERTAHEELLQQPYYSSSPLTSSESDSDEPSTPERSPVLIQDAVLKGTYSRSIQSNRDKDPLQRRSYPFIYPDNTTPRSISVEVTGAPGLNDELLLQEISKHQEPTLLAISNQSISQSTDEGPPHSPIEVSKPNVFYSESGNFTVTFPMNSPTKPSLPTPRQSLEKSSSEESPQGHHDQDAVYKLIEECNKKRDDWRNKNGCDQQTIGNCTESRPGLLKQNAIEIDPGMYFLPPLITTAMRNQHMHNANISTDAKDQFHNLSVCLEEGETSCLESESTEIYAEDGLLKPAVRALPESDTSSLVTECSGVEDIETECLEHESRILKSEIQVVEVPREAASLEAVNSIPVEMPVDCLRPSDENYTSNAENPLPVEAAIEATEHTHKVRKSCPTCGQNSRKKMKVRESAEEKEENPFWVPNGLFSHKVWKDERCPVCNKEKNGKITSSKDTESAGERNEKITEETTPHKPVHSHKVGDDRDCPECSPQHQRLNSDALTGLCCVIL